MCVYMCICVTWYMYIYLFIYVYYNYIFIYSYMYSTIIYFYINVYITYINTKGYQLSVKCARWHTHNAFYFQSLHQWTNCSVQQRKIRLIMYTISADYQLQLLFQGIYTCTLGSNRWNDNHRARVNIRRKKVSL